MWKSPSDSPSAFSYHDPETGQDIHRSTKFSPGCLLETSNYNRILLPVSSNSIYQPNFDTPAESFTPVSEKKHATSYRLFGIELMDHSTFGDSSPAGIGGAAVADTRAPLDTELKQNSEAEPSSCNLTDLPIVTSEPDRSCLRSSLEPHNKQIRSCTKVHMQSIAVGRAVDLTRFDGYEHLLKKFEEIFEIKGELSGSANKWLVVYADNEDDMMMVGDDPWHEFCMMVKKIYIFTAEEAKKLSPKIKCSLNKFKSAKILSEADIGAEEQSSTVGSGC